jgi:hypothetical protein
MGTYFFAKSLLSNGCCTFAYLRVVAQQQIYVQQHKSNKSDLLQNQVLFKLTLDTTIMT